MNTIPRTTTSRAHRRSQRGQNSASIVAGVAALITAVGGTVGVLYQTGVIGHHASTTAPSPGASASPSPGSPAGPSASPSGSPEATGSPGPELVAGRHPEPDPAPDPGAVRGAPAEPRDHHPLTAGARRATPCSRRAASTSSSHPSRASARLWASWM